MPRITIELTDADCLALCNGESITIGTKKKKVSSNPPQDAATSERQRLVIETWQFEEPSMNAGRIWKALREVTVESAEALCCAIRLALDWNNGRQYSPEFFVKDLTFWTEKSGTANEWVVEADRTAYRKKWGLK